MAKSKRPALPKTFAEARERLDAILDELERDGGDVDLLAARIQEASGLIRVCRERLAAARLDVQQVVAELTAEEQAGSGTAGTTGGDPGPGTAEAAPPSSSAEGEGDRAPPLEPPPELEAETDFGQDDLPF